MRLPICNYWERSEEQPPCPDRAAAFEQLLLEPQPEAPPDVMRVCQRVLSGKCPLTAPPHYPLQMFTRVLKAVLSLVNQAHEKRL